MIPRDFYLVRRRAELPVFLRVLQSLPADRLDYKPHDRSPSAAQIVWTITAELKSCADAATQFRAEWSAQSPQPVGQFLWFIHFDAIHHRGQLSTYLRPMGGTVPAIYGPSADSRS